MKKIGLNRLYSIGGGVSETIFHAEVQHFNKKEAILLLTYKYIW